MSPHRVYRPRRPSIRPEGLGAFASHERTFPHGSGRSSVSAGRRQLVDGLLVSVLRVLSPAEKTRRIRHEAEPKPAFEFLERFPEKAGKELVESFPTAFSYSTTRAVAGHRTRRRRSKSRFESVRALTIVTNRTVSITVELPSRNATIERSSGRTDVR